MIIENGVKEVVDKLVFIVGEVVSIFVKGFLMGVCGNLGVIMF